MPPVSPSNEVFAFSAPAVKGAEITFGLRVAAGMATLHAPRALALDLAAAIAGACGFDLVVRPAKEPKRARPPIRKPGGRLL
jgi:hypothetical protein